MSIMSKRRSAHPKEEDELPVVDVGGADAAGVNSDEDSAADESDRDLSASKIEYRLSSDQEKRYRHLLGDSELFDRFVEAKRTGKSPLQILTAQAVRMEKRNSKGYHEDDEGEEEEDVRRHRRTEKDEDADLIHDANEAEPVAPTFSESPSFVVGGTMRTYQVQGLNWLISLYEHRINGILADEMGLGKTLQSLSLLGYLKNYRHINGPHLLVVPKSTLQNWKNESARWVPSLESFVFHGDKEQRAVLIKERLRSANFDVCITSYEMCLSERSALRKIDWEYLMIDEAHRIKNESSKLAIIVRELRSKSRLLITGTPLQNNLHELWSLLNFLLPDIFASSDDFDEWFKSNSGRAQDEMVKQLRQLLQPFLLRRLKSDVEHSLKPKKEVNLYVGMTEMQRLWYRSILERDISAVNGLVKNKEGKMRLLNIVMQLRKCCNHPYLFDGAEPGPPYTTDEHLVQNSGKMLVLDKLLTRLKANDSRVLLFSQMSRVLDILEDYCVYRGYEYCRIDGQTAHEDRIEAIDEYNRPGSKKFIFLLTTRAGGLGINLATADIVILFDSDWNPQVDLQAQDRAHRIGQTKQVCVFRMVTENSIEEKVIEKALQKLRLDQLVIQQGKMTNVNKPLSQEEMLAMIRHGAEQIFSGAGGKGVADEDFDVEELLRRGEERTKELQVKYSNVGYEDLQKFTIGAPNYTAVGREDSEGSGFVFLQPSKRERKSNYAVDSYFREALRIHPQRPKSAKAPMPRNVPVLHDFQFFPARLHDLIEREILAYQRNAEYRIPEGGEEDEEQRADREREQELIDSAVPLTEEEVEEKEELLKMGFAEWTRRDYNAFLKAVERHGREAYGRIGEEVGKGAAEVEKYSRHFWTHLEQLSDYEKIEAMVERTEERIRRSENIQKNLMRKIARHQKARTPLHITYFGGKGKQFTDEEDVFLLESLAEVGYQREDAYEQIHERILAAPQFRFDWFIRTRTAVELQRRCSKLITFIEREQREIDERSSPRKARSRSIWLKNSKRVATSTGRLSAQGP